MQKNQKKNLTRFRRIGITAGKPNCETAIMIFLLQHLTPTELNGKKSKINLFSPKELNSVDFKTKFENPELITINMPANKSGRNYNNIAEVLQVIDNKNEGIAAVLVADIEHTTAPSVWENLFGPTSGNALNELGDKKGKDIITYQENFTKILLPRLTQVCDCINEYRKKVNEKLITLTEHGLTFAQILSEERNNLVRPVAHLAEGVDILFHRRDTEGGNFISTSARAEKYMPIILDTLREEEMGRNKASSGLWHRDFKVIHTDFGKLSALKGLEITSIIEKAVRAFRPAMNGTHMPHEATMHNIAPHNDSAMGNAPVVADKELVAA